MPDQPKEESTLNIKTEMLPRRLSAAASLRMPDEPVALPDTVDEASQESFPASDSPAWKLPQGAQPTVPAVASQQVAEPASVVALEAKSSEKDAEVIKLTDQLKKTDEKADHLAMQQQDLKRQIETAVEKTHELHTKIVAGKNDLGGES